MQKQKNNKREVSLRKNLINYFRQRKTNKKKAEIKKSVRAKTMKSHTKISIRLIDFVKNIYQYKSVLKI